MACGLPFTELKKYNPFKKKKKKFSIVIKSHAFKKTHLKRVNTNRLLDSELPDSPEASIFAPGAPVSPLYSPLSGDPGSFLLWLILNVSQGHTILICINVLERERV